MATDHYGNDLGVGDTVTKVGTSDEFIVTAIKYGGDMVDLSGHNWDENNVNSNDVIVKQKKVYFLLDFSRKNVTL